MLQCKTAGFSFCRVILQFSDLLGVMSPVSGVLDPGKLGEWFNILNTADAHRSWAGQLPHLSGGVLFCFL